MNILPIPKPLPSIPLYNDINKDNIIDLQLIINCIIDSSSLIALDTEFTGLGKISDGIRAKNLTERYKALKNVVSNYALVAFGLSLFHESPKSKEDTNCIQYQNHSFNFLMLPQYDYLQSSKSMKFLIENGFDFNNQALKGIPYFPGELKGKNDNSLLEYNYAMRSIFSRIIRRARKVPVVVHNGLMDLMFLYQSFFATLPDKLDTFVVDLAKMFPCGIYDTKYIADYVIRESSSFLSYLFRKEERMQLYNKNIKKTKYVKCLIKNRIKCIEELKRKKVPMKRPLDTGKIYCEQYAAHGFCIFGKECTKTHNLDVILDEQMKEKLKPSKRKRRKDRKKIRLEKQKEEILKKLDEITNANNNSKSSSETTKDINKNNNEMSENNVESNESSVDSNQNDNNNNTENSDNKIDVNPENNNNNDNENSNNNTDVEGNDNKKDDEKENNSSINVNEETIETKNENEIDESTENESQENKPEVVESLIQFENKELQNQSNLQKQDTPNQVENVNNTISTSSVVIKNFETYHSAYFDAFMTGYVFCCQCNESDEKIIGSDHVNKLYVIGKPMPLLIHSSPYTKNSENCLKILETI